MKRSPDLKHSVPFVFSNCGMSFLFISRLGMQLHLNTHFKRDPAKMKFLDRYSWLFNLNSMRSQAAPEIVVICRSDIGMNKMTF